MLGADPTPYPTMADDFSQAEIPSEPLETPEATATVAEQEEVATDADDAASDVEADDE
jgi:hypothetical protein